METKFDKNVFFSYEQAAALVKVDNHACALKVKQIEFVVKQQLRITGFRQWAGNWPIIKNIDNAGIPAKATMPSEKEMTLNFSAIRYVVTTQKRKKKPGTLMSTHLVDRTPEELFMLGQLAPACHSPHITNEYFLQVVVKFDGCTCDPSPAISIPLTIIPQTDMNIYGFPEPEGFNPHVLGTFSFNPIP